MGKKGDLLRQQKAQRATYTFTAEQLQEHDRQVVSMALERKKTDLQAHVNDVLEKEFEKRQQLLTGTAEDVTVELFSLLISVPCRVLVERFGWPPIWKHSTSRNRLTRFATAVQEEVESILNDECKDIRKYAEEAYEITGVKFEADEELDEIRKEREAAG